MARPRKDSRRKVMVGIVDSCSRVDALKRSGVFQRLSKKKKGLFSAGSRPLDETVVHDPASV